MIYCIGERVNDRSIPTRRVDRWAQLWRGETGKATTMDYIQLTPAMTRGASCLRLCRTLGMRRRDFLVWNLLPPDNRPGRWDAGWAREVAQEVMDWFGTRSGDQFVVLLGRRVADAFRLPEDVEFGDSVVRGQVHFLSLPHPSGRNRFWNDPERTRAVVDRTRQFLKGQVDEQAG